jgi:hypothetical protein
MFLSSLKRLVLLPCLVPLAVTSAQTIPQTEKQPTENGSIALGIDGGWSFGFPAVRAAVQVGDVTAISPEKKVLPAYGAFVGVRVNRFLMPFFRLNAIDTGKATAQVGSTQSQVQANTYGLNGGIRFVATSSTARPYAQFGGGILRQDASGTFSMAGTTIPVSGNGSVGTFNYGGGLQYLIGRKWGVDVGFDGFRVSHPLNGAGQNFGQLRFGWFYQTKSTSK